MWRLCEISPCISCIYGLCGMSRKVLTLALSWLIDLDRKLRAIDCFTSQFFFHNGLSCLCLLLKIDVSYFSIYFLTRVLLIIFTNTHCDRKYFIINIKLFSLFVKYVIGLYDGLVYVHLVYIYLTSHPFISSVMHQSCIGFRFTWKCWWVLPNDRRIPKTSTKS